MMIVYKFLSLIVLLTALVAPSAIKAQANPPATPVVTVQTSPTTTADWQLPLTALGFSAQMQLSGQIAQRDLFIPVPAGLRAVSLSARTQFSADVQSGYLEVRSGDRLLTTINLPTSDNTVTIPLAGAQVRGGVIPLTLTARLRSQDDVCSTALIGAWLDLNNGQINYHGSASPTTVADFLPPLLTHLTILVPPDVNASEAAAALQLTAALTARYQGQKMAIHLAALAARGAPPTSVSSSPFERTIVINSGDPASISLQSNGIVPVLLISGSGDDLSKQVGLFLGSDALALAPSVQVQTLVVPTPAPATNLVTFAALGFTNLQVSGIGRLELPFTVSQADLGEPINSLSFRIAGTYTPMQSDDRGTLSLLVNGTLIDAAALDSSGRFDRTVSVPGDVLSRDNTLTIRFDYVPAQAACRVGLQPFTGQIDGGSYVQFGGGQSLPTGFDRFPQSFVNSFQTAFEKLDPAALASAVNIVAALQRATKTTLQPTVVNWSDALTAKSPVLLISATSAAVTVLNPPLTSQPIRVVSASGTELLRIDANATFAALEGFAQNGRDLLLTQGDESAVNTLTQSLLTDDLGWFGLQGDTWVQVQNAAPVSMTLQGQKLTAQPLTVAPQPWYVQALPIVGFVILLIIVLALLALAYPRVVRKTPAGAKS
ncbi:MAG TPA: cellulose biosynthesis cyclic di-GMP-binding regulatory protein BcsB [Phototrophicaceae bacterium]|nr:cellulose biosynthesis cyclic di-GMP-binding regulatory protein BcsB [Phototrophicaceae bacterium]